MEVSLGKADEVLVVCVHVGQLAVYVHHDLLLALLLLLPKNIYVKHSFSHVCASVPDVGGDDPLSLLPEPRIARHLWRRFKSLPREGKAKQ